MIEPHGAMTWPTSGPVKARWAAVGGAVFVFGQFCEHVWQPADGGLVDDQVCPKCGRRQGDA